MSFSTFFDHSFIGQFMAVFIITFMLFVLLMRVKKVAIKLRDKGGFSKILAYLLFYPLAIIFLVADVILNIYLTPIFGERPNKHGEGWLVTDRIKRLIQIPGKSFKKWAAVKIYKLIIKVDPEHFGSVIPV